MTCELSSNTASPGTSVTLDLFLEDAVDVRGYQATIAITPTSGSGEVTVPCPGGVAVDEDRPDFIFPDLDSENLGPDCTDCGMAVPFCKGQRVAVARVTGGVEVGEAPAHLASYTLDISPDASPGSTFEISILPFPASIVGASDKAPIPFDIGPPCVLTIESEGCCFDDGSCTMIPAELCVAEGGRPVPACLGDQDGDGKDDACPGIIPTVSEWGLVVMTLLLLTALKIKFGRRGPKTTGSGASLLSALVLVLAMTNTASAGGRTGACCLFEGNCVESAEFDCTVEFEGIYQGDGTLCEGDADGDGVDGMCGDACPDDPEDLCEGCLENIQCDDGNVCTFDQCIESSCSNTPANHADVASIDGCGPDGAVDLFDTSAVADGFRETFSEGCSSHNLDIKSSSGCEPDGAVDLFDLMAVLDAFAGTANCPCPPSRSDVEPPGRNRGS